MRNHQFSVGEYYHIYNRGTEKRQIFLDQKDLERFMKSLIEFNTEQPIGSLHELQYNPRLGTPSTKSSTKSNAKPLVSIIAYCLNPNHFHLILTPLIENGIQKYMQRIAGYTRYFNEKYKRSGALFQGRFKSKHIHTNEYLLHVSAYVNMNNRDELGTPSTKLSRSSFEEFTEGGEGICDRAVILEQFKDGAAYKKFAIDAWEYSQSLKMELET